MRWSPRTTAGSWWKMVGKNFILPANFSGKIYTNQNRNRNNNFSVLLEYHLE